MSLQICEDHGLDVHVARGTLRRALGSAFVLDRSRADFGFAARCSVGVAIPLIAALAAGSPSLGVPGAPCDRSKSASSR
jgi:hypothetical protein